MQPKRNYALSWIAAIVAVTGPGWGDARAELRLTVPQPAPRQFVQDLAGLLTPEAARQIDEIADKLLTERATPLVVVTIDSMAQYGGAGLRIETFALLLFNQWELGIAQHEGQDWNTGILLLVSKGDRRARIELGAGWAHEKDRLCQQIMNEQIVPRFKAGDFSGGILAGVQALDQMARDKPLPRPPVSWSQFALVAGGIGLAVFTLVSLARRGSGGWAWLLWAGVFSLVGFLLYSMLTSSNRNRSWGGVGGGGFSGGSFGGGFSGGGGASGSW